MWGFMWVVACTVVAKIYARDVVEFATLALIPLVLALTIIVAEMLWR
jgi:hypothetical protein